WKVVDAGRLVAYGISHPWTLGRIPQLDAFLGGLPQEPDCLYVHDVVVAPEARGRSLAEAYLERIQSIARGRSLPALALVSVYGTTRLWARTGFKEEASPALEAKLASYGATARYMVCRFR
ncbi:MAG TPA: GNAT family N-acetyltransferase, partial [Holophaga sp.]|nr:GNAT family N-acetyltransferase [Holophaga sp.]